MSIKRPGLSANHPGKIVSEPMLDENPYQFKPADGEAEAAEEELLDAEARQRILASLSQSYLPMRLLAGLLALTSMSLIVITLIVFAVAFRDSRSLGQVVDALAAFAVALFFWGAAFTAAAWLWSCSNAIDRARNRLTIASLANAVQSQALFWRKLAFLAAAMVIVFAVAALFTI